MPYNSQYSLAGNSPDFRSTLLRGKMRSYSDLPEEITVDILSRLPVKDAGCCRCVSNPWRSLLSRPDFIRIHLNRSRNLRPESLLLVSEAKYVRTKQPKVRHPLYYASLSNAHQVFDEITLSAKRVKFSSKHNFVTRIHGSCDGLLLVGNWNGEIFVLNPITNEVREVPKSPFALEVGDCSLLYGLGYDSVSDDYKIVIIAYGFHESEDEDDNATEMFTNVFSLKTGVWNKCEGSPYNHAEDQFSNGVFLDGCIHWLGWTKDWKPTVVAFDLAQEKFHEVALPNSIDCIMCLFHYRFSGLVALGGCLCTFNEREKVVWVMKEYGVQESWTDLMIDDPEIVDTKPICMMGKVQVVLKDREKLIIYNLAKRTEDDDDEDDDGEEEEEIVKNVLVNGFRRDLVNETSFVESLLSPYSMNETTVQ